MIDNIQLFVDGIEKRREANKLDLFSDFIWWFNNPTKEELIKTNKQLKLTDFTDLIEKYYD